MVRVCIAGATGYTGFELVKIFINHPDAKISCLTSDSRVGEKYSSVYPKLYSLCDNVLETNDYDIIADKSDAVFLCLPHKASMDAAFELHKRGVRVFDLSADYRFNQAELYEKVYETKHTHPEFMQTAVYGLAEIYTKELVNADFVAVPGCYPTSILIPLIPLLKEGLIENNLIIADSKSAVSGAGKKASATTHFCEANEDVKPYGLYAHRHKPEIDHIIKRAAFVDTDIIFTPHLLPMTRGMLSTIYVKSGADTHTLKEKLKRFYESSRLVRIIDTVPAVKNVANTPFIDINVFGNNKSVTIVSALDNLLKGASSQAVQCFNLSFGLEPAAGLI